MLAWLLINAAFRKMTSGHICLDWSTPAWFRKRSGTVFGNQWRRRIGGVGEGRGAGGGGADVGVAVLILITGSRHGLREGCDGILAWCRASLTSCWLVGWWGPCLVPAASSVPLTGTDATAKKKEAHLSSLPVKGGAYLVTRTLPLAWHHDWDMFGQFFGFSGWFWKIAWSNSGLNCQVQRHSRTFLLKHPLKDWHQRMHTLQPVLYMYHSWLEKIHHKFQLVFIKINK